MKNAGKKADVAIKVVKLDVMTKEQIQNSTREARLMRDFNHPNVVRLDDVVATQEPLMVVMKLASNGFEERMHAGQVDGNVSAWGIQNLYDKNCFHRDIACIETER